MMSSTVISVPAAFGIWNAISMRLSSDWKDRFIEAYDIELTHWVKTLEEKGEPDGPSAWDGYAACVAADALNRSRGTGRFLPVETMEKPELYR